MISTFARRRRHLRVLGVTAAALTAVLATASLGGCGATPPATVQAPSPLPAVAAVQSGNWYVLSPIPLAQNSFFAEVTAGIKAAGTSVTVLEANSPADIAGLMERAVAADADLIITLGQDSLDETDHIAAENLNQQFLIVGAQPGEPTANLTTALFDKATCPKQATCVDTGDIFDPAILTQSTVPDVGAALASSLTEVHAGRTGTIALYTLGR